MLAVVVVVIVLMGQNAEEAAGAQLELNRRLVVVAGRGLNATGPGAGAVVGESPCAVMHLMEVVDG